MVRTTVGEVGGEVPVGGTAGTAGVMTHRMLDADTTSTNHGVDEAATANSDTDHGSGTGPARGDG